MNFYKDSILLVLGFALKLIFALLTDRLIAIHVIPDLYGLYKYSITILTVLSNLANLGFHSSIVRTVALYQNNLNHLLKIILISTIVISLFSGILIIVFSITSIQDLLNIEYHEIFNIILVGLLGFSFNQFFIGIYSAFKTTKVKVFINDILQPVLLFLSIYLISTRFEISIKQICLIYTGLLYLIFLINASFVSQILKHKLGRFRDFKFATGLQLKEYYKYSLPIFVTTIIIALSTNIDKFVLAQVVEKIDIGIYFSAFTLSSVLNFILTSLLFLFLPIASNYYTRGKYKIGSQISSYISKWLMLISFIPFWLLFYYSSDVIFYFYGPEYTDGVQVLKILSVAGFINVSVGFTGQNLLALGDSINQMRIRISGFILGLFLALLLGRYFGIMGISISVLITLIATNLYQLLIAFFKHKVILFQKINMYVFLFISLAIISLYIRHFVFRTDFFLLDFFLDILIYMGFIVILKIINTEDKRIVKLINKG